MISLTDLYCPSKPVALNRGDLSQVDLYAALCGVIVDMPERKSSTATVTMEPDDRLPATDNVCRNAAVE